MIRFLNEADVILKNVSDETLHFYFFGNDMLVMAACYNFRPQDPMQSTVQYSSEEAFREEIRDMLEGDHYEILKGAEEMPPWILVLVHQGGNP